MEVPTSGSRLENIPQSLNMSAEFRWVMRKPPTQSINTDPHVVLHAKP